MIDRALVYEQPRATAIDNLGPALLDAFEAIRAGLIAGRPVVVVLREADLLGHGEPGDAALAGGLVGLTRALGVEAAREGWSINALAVSPDTPPNDRAAWVERLAEPSGISGELIRLGALHLGRVTV